jgi:hypothetical protein
MVLTRTIWRLELTAAELRWRAPVRGGAIPLSGVTSGPVEVKVKFPPEPAWPRAGYQGPYGDPARRPARYRGMRL